MREVGERLYTPKDLNDARVISHVRQWQLRKSGELGFYQFGRKIYYGQRHLDTFLASCERSAHMPAAV